MAKSISAKYWRIKMESAFNAANPESGEEWNEGGGGNGWVDLPVVRESDGLQPGATIIYPSSASGSRAMNNALPVAGAIPTDLGNLEFAIYPELSDRPLLMAFGSVARVETPGTAALASTLFSSLASLDTQPTSTEQLKFTISGATASTGAKINILVDAVIQETISIPDALMNGDFYSKGGYAPTVTFTVEGTNDGNVVVAGISYVTSTFTFADTVPTAVIQQGGRIESNANSEYFAGCVTPTLGLAYDRATPDSLLIGNLTVQGIYSAATPNSYKNDAAEYYRPFAGWTGKFVVNGSDYCEVQSMNANIQPNNQMLVASCGVQTPTEKVEGFAEVFGTLTLVPNDSTPWDQFLAAQEKNWQLTFTSPYFVNASVPYSLNLSMNQLTFESYTRNTQQTMAQGADVAFRCISNPTDSGAAKIITVGRMPV